MKIIQLNHEQYKVQSKRTLCIYTVYALRIDKHNTITEYFINNHGSYEWWPCDDFREVKKKVRRICSCCCHCILCNGDEYE